MTANQAGFRVGEISGKGIGMIALKRFQVGDLIVRETPLINMPKKVFDNPQMDMIERWLDRKINSLSSEGRREFYDLSDCRSLDNGNKTTLGIFFTNCMTFLDDDTALFPIMARVNHSCTPRAEFVTNRSKSNQDLIAVTDINPGEEITLSYLSSSEEGSEITSKRMDYLRRQYAFQCVCQTCRNVDQDNVRLKIKSLQSKKNQLSVYELEEMIDGLELIGGKRVHLTEVYQELLDKAIKENDKVLIHKSLSSIHLYKRVIGAEDAQHWMEIMKHSKNVEIDGQSYMFPPEQQ